jgi:hypothetical protein
MQRGDDVMAWRRRLDHCVPEQSRCTGYCDSQSIYSCEVERMNSGAAYQLTACYGITDCRKNDDAGSLLERAEAALQEACRNESGVSIADS